MIFKHLLINAIWLAMLCVSPASAGIFDKTYDNGLRLVLRQDHRAPVVVSQLWYHVGSSDEHIGITGISHLLEHLMFKGTKAVSGEEFSRLLAENGAQDNAFTGKHYTTYYQRIASNQLELCLRLEADRMTNLIFDEASFRRELEVIKEERNLRVENRPLNRFFENFSAAVFQQSPLRNPVIGWPQDIAQLTLTQAKDWYRRWYAPNNATLVVVGDVDFDTLDKLVERYFSTISSKPISSAVARHEPPQNGLKVVNGYGRVSSPYLVMAYRAPILKGSENPADAFAMQVLAAILDGGNSARFMRHLQREQALAVSASAGYNALDPLEGLLTITAKPVEGVDMAVLQAGVVEQINRLKREAVNEKELERVKAQVVSGRTYGQDSMFNMAMQIGVLATAGQNLRLIDEYSDHIKSIDAADIKRVANLYLNNDSLTIGKFWPEQHRP